MRMTRLAALLLATAALGACVPRRAAPPPVVTPPPVVIATPPAPLPPPPPAPNLAWTEAPLSPGNWTWRSAGATSSAEFGPAGSPSFSVRCLGRGQVQLQRSGDAAGNLTLRTSNVARTLAAAPSPQGPTATLPATDPLLDAMIFSRGRFAVETSGLPRLVVPAWPELARVVQDCRER